MTTIKAKPFYELWHFRLPQPCEPLMQCQNNGVNSPPTSVLSRGDEQQHVWLIALRVVSHFVKLTFLQNHNLEAKTRRLVLNHSLISSDFLIEFKRLNQLLYHKSPGSVVWFYDVAILPRTHVCFLTHARSHRAVQLWLCSKTCKWTLLFPTSRNKK